MPIIQDDRLITRHYQLSFLVDLREEEEDPIRAKRGLFERRLPKPVTVEEGPFSFTLSHEQHKEEEQSIVIGLAISRKDITGDVSLDCAQAVGLIEYHRRVTYEITQDEVVYLKTFPNLSANLASGRNSEMTVTGKTSFAGLPLLFGDEEPLVAEMVISIEMDAEYQVSPTSNLSSLHSLDNLGAFVSSPRPNDVIFILSSAPTRPLYSNKAVLSAASPYFKNHFDPLSRPRRATESIKHNPSFVDDSDAESVDSDNSDDDLLPLDQVVSQRSKRKTSGDRESEKVTEEGTHEEEEAQQSGKNGGSPKKKKGNGQKSPSKVKKVKTEEENSIFEIHVDDGSYATMQAILVYLMCSQIEFAPLSSLGRDEFVKEYRKRHPDRPVPVSPRSVYRLATRFELSGLQERALAHLKYSFTFDSAIREALSEDCYHFPKYCSLVHDQLARDWTKVKDSQIWKDVLKDAEKGRFPHSNILLPRLLLKV